MREVIKFYDFDKTIARKDRDSWNDEDLLLATTIDKYEEGIDFFDNALSLNGEIYKASMSQAGLPASLEYYALSKLESFKRNSKGNVLQGTGGLQCPCCNGWISLIDYGYSYDLDDRSKEAKEYFERNSEDISESTFKCRCTATLAITINEKDDEDFNEKPAWNEVCKVEVVENPKNPIKLI